MKPEVALALIIKRWRDWQEIVPYQFPSQQEAERQNIIKLFKLYKKMKEKNNLPISKQVNALTLHLNEHKHKISPSDQKKEIEIRTTQLEPINDQNYFENIRMDVETYNELYKLLEYKIKKQHVIKVPISSHTRLQLTLKYLATGESMLTLAIEFKIARNTVSKIVSETCQAIYDVLKDKFLPNPNKNIWEKNAQAFESKYDFPHCAGAIIGKEIIHQVHFSNEPKSCGKEGLIFFAVIDANYCFTLINIAIEKMQNGKVIFSKTNLQKNLQENVYDLPTLQASEDDSELPYVLLGNEDFPLTTKILRPYMLYDNLEESKNLFNCKVQCIKKHAEHTFSIFTSCWQIFQKKFGTSISNTTNILNASVCLFNFLINKKCIKTVEGNRYFVLAKQNKNIQLQGCLNIRIYLEKPSDEAKQLRNKFKDYLVKKEAIGMEYE